MTWCSGRSTGDTEQRFFLRSSSRREPGSSDFRNAAETLDSGFRRNDEKNGFSRMKATGHYADVKDVDPLVELDAHTREHIDHWVAKFPPERKRSALIQGLFAAQEQNGGH